MNPSRLLLAAGACAAVACSSGGTEPLPSADQLTIAARPSGTDSIFAEPIQALGVEPRDTTIHLGASAQYRAHVVDRFGNARPDAVTVTISSTPGGIASVDGAGRMTTAGVGLVG